MLTVEGVFTLDDAGVGIKSQRFAGLLQRGGQLEIGNSGIFNGRILQRGVLITDSAGGNNDITGLHIQVNTAAGARPQEGVRADFYQFLHGNGSGGATDSGGADRYFFAQQRAGPDVVFPIHANMDRVVEMPGNGFASARISG